MKIITGETANQEPEEVSDTPSENELTVLERRLLTILVGGGHRLFVEKGERGLIIAVRLDDPISGQQLDLETVRTMSRRHWISYRAKEKCYVLNTKGARVLKARS